MSQAGGAAKKRQHRKDRCEKREEGTNNVTEEATGRGESGGGSGRRQGGDYTKGKKEKRTARMASLWGYTVTHNRKRG